VNVAGRTSFEQKGREIRAEIQTTATTEQAWEAWADPEKIAQWFVDRVAGANASLPADSQQKPKSPFKQRS
jgi:uncharacterized protein YndB with AHSA1/START domain